jgi:dTMP kinase
VGTIDEVHERVLEVIEPLLAARDLVRTPQEDA